MEYATYYLANTLLLTGALFALIGGIGILRLPDFYMRIHAAGVTEILGTILILTGIAIHSGFTLDAAKVLAILLFLLLTGPTSAYALANAAWLSGVKPELGPEHDTARDI